MRLLNLCLSLCLVVSMCAPRASAQGMEPIELGSHLAKGWVPDHVPVLRGTLLLNGEQIKPLWRECAAYWGYAIIRFSTDGYELDPERLRDLDSSGLSRKGM